MFETVDIGHGENSHIDNLSYSQKEMSKCGKFVFRQILLRFDFDFLQDISCISATRAKELYELTRYARLPMVATKKPFILHARDL